VSLRIYGVGEPSYVRALKQKIAALGLVDRVEWLGFVDDQDEIYGAIDLCAMPSRFDEPFGLSAIEAAMRGRPTVCSARGGLTEIVEGGVTGLVVEAKRPDSLAAAIASLAADRSRLRDMGEAARERARARYSTAALASRFAAVLPSPKSCGDRPP
jgi:glycogen(starch) synthase